MKSQTSSCWEEPHLWTTLESHKIPHRFQKNWTQASTVLCWHHTAWDTAQPQASLYADNWQHGVA